jgi:enoyl-CoA hydratase/carnithine racemase
MELHTKNEILLEEKEQVLIISLNRPEKRNACNDSLILALEHAFDHLASSIKCVIIRGNGTHFSAGLDLSELKERDIVQGLQHSQMWHRVMNKIQFASCPVVAILHGAVVGGGLEIASACHIRIAEKSTFYALPEGQRGIFVGGGASVRLPKLIGAARMTDMMLTGRVFNAEEGERIGMAQYLVEDGEGMTKGMEIAQKIASNAGLTNYALTHVLPKIVDSNQQEGLMLESLMAAIAQDAPEAKKRLTDFLEGRSKKVGE